MKIKRLKYYLWLIFGIFTFSQASAEFVPDSLQIQPVRIPSKNIDTYKSQKAFVYEIKTNTDNFILRAWDWFKRKLYFLLEKILNWLFGVKNGGKILQLILKALPYVAVIVFVYIIFRFLIGVDLIQLKKNRHQNLNKVYLSDEERIIQEEDLEQLIAEAIRQKQYRLAVRYYYLNVLKKLMNAGLIEWHDEKTNRDYVRELSQTKVFPLFKNLTFIYDYVWYGNYRPAEKEFKEIEKDFNSFQV